MWMRLPVQSKAERGAYQVIARTRRVVTSVRVCVVIMIAIV